MSLNSRIQAASKFIPMARRCITRSGVMDGSDSYVVKLIPPCKLYRPRAVLVTCDSAFGGTTPTMDLDMFLISSGAAQSEITFTARTVAAEGHYFCHEESGRSWSAVPASSARTASDNFQIVWAGDPVFSTVDGDGRVTSGNDDMCIGVIFGFGAGDSTGDVHISFWYDELGENESDLR